MRLSVAKGPSRPPNRIDPPPAARKITGKELLLAAGFLLHAEKETSLALMASRAWLVILVALACALSGVSCRSLRLSKDVLPRKNLAGGLLLLSSAPMHLLSTGSPSQFADKGIPSPSKSALECVNPIQYDER